MNSDDGASSEDQRKSDIGDGGGDDGEGSSILMTCTVGMSLLEVYNKGVYMS